MQYYEDLQVGHIERFGSYPVTREEVIAFATAYDPQPFHLDDDAAAQTHFGRLAASGWHTGAMAMRMMVDHWAKIGHSGLGSPGLDELRWLRPVYPGDTLKMETELLAKRLSQSRPEMGLIKSISRVYNQDDVLVMSFISNGLVGRRID
jgi:hypothetical protein